MSPESDYSYPDPSLPPEQSYSAAPFANPFNSPLLLPFALLSTALAFVMIAQTTAVFRQKSALQDNKVQLAEAIKNRETLVKQSGDLQTKLQAMILDLLLLGKTDDDAKAIIAKYNIQQNAPPKPAP